MAVVRTTITPTQDYLPFAGYTDSFAKDTSRARAQIIATTLNGSVAASGAGDNQEVLVDIRLPVNFAYVMTDFQIGISSTAGSANNFGNNGVLRIRNAATGNNIDIMVSMTSPGVTAIDTAGTQEVQVYSPSGCWGGLVVPLAPQQVRFFFQLLNETANDAAYSVQVGARFLQYNIEQSLNLEVNTPIPTR